MEKELKASVIFCREKWARDEYGKSEKIETFASSEFVQDVLHILYDVHSTGPSRKEEVK